MNSYSVVSLNRNADLITVSVEEQLFKESEYRKMTDFSFTIMLPVSLCYGDRERVMMLFTLLLFLVQTLSSAHGYVFVCVAMK